MDTKAFLLERGLGGGGDNKGRNLKMPKPQLDAKD